ncbi:hypothetical protein jhhlp_001297 [Lomentospora prolificans]|uniref:WSC domain-containing protein n=1 Tax=Lomentospora prolificans TaxID=41688 RepID=A0A2N3NHX0_9PEZI|nr:hypothetical protein jhhlp_001297 [Lomentospora prolificans]
MTNAPVLWMDLLSLAMISYADPKIYAGSDKYHYRGCYNETAHLPHTPGERAVAPGTNHVFANSMTVPMCLDFCDPGDKAYRAKLTPSHSEYWCSDFLPSLSRKVGETRCVLSCDSTKDMVCGGSEAKTIYELQSSVVSILHSSRVALMILALVASSLLLRGRFGRRLGVGPRGGPQSLYFSIGGLNLTPSTKTPDGLVGS